MWVASKLNVLKLMTVYEVNHRWPGKSGIGTSQNKMLNLDILWILDFSLENTKLWAVCELS